MPVTFVHVGFNFLMYFLISLVYSIEFLLLNCLFLLFAELIDLDHLFAKPIYHPRRNPFKVHFLHKRWKFVLMFALFCLLFSSWLFLGIGLISHIILDYVYTKYWLKL